LSHEVISFVFFSFVATKVPLKESMIVHQPKGQCFCLTLRATHSQDPPLLIWTMANRLKGSYIIEMTTLLSQTLDCETFRVSIVLSSYKIWNPIWRGHLMTIMTYDISKYMPYIIHIKSISLCACLTSIIG